MDRGCILCGYRCGVDRSSRTGRCGIDSEIYISHYGLHRGEEPFLTGNSGSGTIFFSGCTLNCLFCQNFQISRWRCSRGLEGVEKIDPARLVEIFFELKDAGASNINFVSPTPYVIHIIKSVTEAKKRGFDLPFVYNTHGYDSVETIDSLMGIIDVYLPDMKYGNDETGRLFSGPGDLYTAGKECIKRIYSQAGLLKFSDDGSALRGTAVRHLVLPGHVENSFQVLDFLETVDRSLNVSLMSQYHPSAEAGEGKFPELKRTLYSEEYRRVVEYAQNMGFRNLLLQEMESHISYLPDFERDEVFRE